MTVSAAGHTAVAQELRLWLTDRIAVYLERESHELDRWTPLADFGMDSACALCLCGDIEEEQGLIVAPTLVWDHPTIDALIAHLAPMLADRNGTV